MRACLAFLAGAACCYHPASELEPGAPPLEDAGTTDAGPAPCGALANGDFAAGNGGFSTGYAYVAPPARIDTEGQYTVAPDPGVVAIWPDWISFGDPWGGHGNLLIVNGAPVAGTAVWSETLSVDPGVTYTFSYWLATVNATSNSPAALQASANGEPLGGAFTAPTSGGVWRQFSATWTAPGPSATLALVDTNTQRSLNDFAIDGVSFACPGR